VGFSRSRSAPERARPIVRATLVFPKNLTLPVGDRSIAVSPDGTQVVVSLQAKDGTSAPSLYVRDLSRLEFRALPGTEEASYPFWSPDGRSIAFFAGRELRRIDLADDIVRVICKAPAGRGGAWGTQGTIVLAPSAAGGLSIVDEAGGDASPITEPTAPGESQRVPQMLPDGRRFLYFVMNSAKPGVYSFDPESRQSRFVVASEAEAVFVEPASLVFARDGNLVVQPFDPVRVELTGSPTPIAAGVHWDCRRGALGMSLSARGTLVYQPVVRAGTYRLAWMTRTGARTPLPIEPLALAGGTLAPDGRRAAVNLAGDRGESLLAVLDLERGIRVPIGDPLAKFYYGVLCSRDGQRVLTTDSNADRQFLVSFPLGGGSPERLLEGDAEYEYAANSITPDGRTLLFTKVPMRDKIGDIMVLDFEGERLPKPFMTTSEAEWRPSISPSGDVVAYFVSDEEGVGAVLKVAAYPTPSSPLQVSSARVSGVYGWLAARELYWLDLARMGWSATITAQSGQLDVSSPTPMFDGLPLSEGVEIVAYDLPRERFLVAIEDSAREDPQLILVSDWRPEAVAAQAARK
jgi:Tol biopolymer transport system component